MSFHIEDFMATMDAHGGLMRSNKFKIFIPPPPTMTGIMAQTMREVPFFAENVSLPGVNLSTHEVRRYGYGPIEKRPIGHTFTDLTVTFIQDGYGDVHWLMKEWIMLVSSFDSSNGIDTGVYLMNYKTNYVTDMHVLIYPERGQTGPVIDLVLRECYPIAITDTQFSWSEKNNYSKINVQFSFTDWYLEDPGLSEMPVSSEG